MHVLEHIERRGRIEGEPGAAAGLADQLQRAIDVHASFRVEGDDVGAGAAKRLDERIHRLHHQVHVEQRAPSAPARWQ